ncbi:MAG: tRNA (guanine(26)-N(2))-dimethyltransferase [archaeon]
MEQIVGEGKAIIKVASEKKISKKLPVFYNPVMKLNRDISVLLLNSVSDKDLQIALPLAGSGIRGLRFLLELKNNKIKTLYINDYKEDFYNTIRENFKLNKLPSTDIILSNDDANLFILNNSGFDYIDIDPFGSPNPFLDSAITRLSRNGILAVTATDTSALSGTFENACRRKYWAKPLRNELKHEVGIRILIRKVQLVAAQYEKALVPILSYSKEHYFRVFFRCEKGKTKVDEVLKKHEFFHTAGPMWTGFLHDKKLVKKMLKNSDGEAKKLLTILSEELDTIGFYDIHQICEDIKKTVPKYDVLMKKITNRGFSVSRTHFSGFGIRSNIEKEELLVLIRQLV